MPHHGLPGRRPCAGIPDLTKGGELTRINKRWVGPVGIHCGAWRARGRSNEPPRFGPLVLDEIRIGPTLKSVMLGTKPLD
jgi:hypothetical protein